MRIRYQVKMVDYNNGIRLLVEINRTKGGEDVPTNGDLLDTVINVVAPKIRLGKLRGEL